MIQLPGILYMIMPIALVIVYPRLVRLPPQGSVVLESFKVFRTLFSRAGFTGMLKGGENWNVAKPSNIEAAGGLKNKSTGWVTWDDDFVDELKRTIVACKLFLFLPIFNIADDGISTIQNNQGASLTTNGAPNDLLGNFNSLTIIFAVPLWGSISPIRRIVCGFLVAALAMVVGAIIQWKIYTTSPCGYQASDCSIGTGVSPISVWVQIPLYSLPALAEIFINVTSYEIAYTRAPQRMKGVVFAIVLFMSAISLLSPWPSRRLFHKMDDEEASVLAIGTTRKIEGRTAVFVNLGDLSLSGMATELNQALPLNARSFFESYSKLRRHALHLPSNSVGTSTSQSAEDMNSMATFALPGVGDVREAVDRSKMLCPSSQFSPPRLRTNKYEAIALDLAQSAGPYR
ncbi:hypothetical protein B0H14DRAFT_3655087 [Mycena olivaceomarginata]|nr:hypothetical protein B0H14DRAFT_3655087 [Mycena olivaceomarginata]